VSTIFSVPPVIPS